MLKSPSAELKEKGKIEGDGEGVEVGQTLGMVIVCVLLQLLGAPMS
jgi:hypothetical protein